MGKLNGIKQKFRDLMGGEGPVERDMNYVVAVSTGIKVSEDIPGEAHKRIAWASNQGASLVSFFAAGPAQIYNEWDDLLSVSKQLGLSYDAHLNVQVPLDFANPYREQRGGGQMGFYGGHEFLKKMITAWGEFKQELRNQEDVNGNVQDIYGINGHLVKSSTPTHRERMAGSVSVDPFGKKIMESKIFDVPEFRVSFFKHFLWEERLRDSFNTLQSIVSELENFRDYEIISREEFVDYMKNNSYLTDSMLESLSRIDEDDQIRENITWIAKNKQGEVDLPSLPAWENLKKPMNPYSRLEEIYSDSKERYEELQEISEENPHKAYLKMSKEGKNAYIEDVLFRQGSKDILRNSAIQNIAGIRADIPDSIEKLEEHREGLSIAQNIPRFDPNMYTNSRWVYLIPKEIWTRKKDLTDTEDFRKANDAIRENIKHRIKDKIIEKLKVEESYGGFREWIKSRDSPSKGKVMFRDLINFGGGRFRDLISRESTIYWQILPRWMPFAENKKVKRIWEEITGIDPSNYGLSNLDKYNKKLKELKESDDEDKIIAAGAGAFVWGHMTQIKSNNGKTLVELLDEMDLQIHWESHNPEAGSDVKLWKPRDIIKVCKAINETQINGKRYDAMRATIDMEHIMMNGVDPLWVIEGNEEKGYQGLDSGDGRMIKKQHVTHPGMSERSHEHGVIRHGDLTVFKHIESLVDKGYCQRDDEKGIMLYEYGGETAESVSMLKLIMNMLEAGITSDMIKKADVGRLWDKYNEGNEDLKLKDFLILKFYGLTDEEWHIEWQEVNEHALAPLEDLMELSQPKERWSSERQLKDKRRQPERINKEEYQ
ncbi:MAG: hypothetical protein MUP58_02285 [Candidatus Nanohaloarchaeota archaeon QJJ-9]|nr:hypothetical protein [Candidatus Nanohaloarchaeota archaeon QJJ-9]